jgi:hypothetical protein
MSLDAISRDLINGLPQEVSEPSPIRDAKTKAISRVLQRLGHAKGLFVCGHGCQDDGEWLLDQLWMDRKDWRIVLAVESEWGNEGEIESDFLKLLSVKAHKKLMIFSTTNQTANVLERLRSLMVKYPFHLAGEEYMALDITMQGVIRHSFTVPSNGRLEAASFAHLHGALDWPWGHAVAASG